MRYQFLHVQYLKYVLHGIWISKNYKVQRTLFFIIRTTLEWCFVAKITKEWQLEMHSQVDQVVKHFMQYYMHLIQAEDGGIRPNIYKINKK